MKIYHVYWIQEKIAKHFYYKNDVLYRFLRTYHHHQNREDLAMQFYYITNNIPTTMFLSQLRSNQRSETYIKMDRNQIELTTNRTHITLHIYEKYIEFHCQTLEDAEYLLFPTFRLFHSYFFIMDRKHNHYGWISSANSKQRRLL